MIKNTGILQPGESKTVEFVLTPGIGHYRVNVDYLQASFSVEERPAAIFVLEDVYCEPSGTIWAPAYVNIYYTIKNIGNQTGDATVSVYGALEREDHPTIAPGASVQIHAAGILNSPGINTVYIAIDDQEPYALDIPVETEPYPNIICTAVWVEPSVCQIGNQVTIFRTYENTGDQYGTIDALITANGIKLGGPTIHLHPQHSNTIETLWIPTVAGTYLIDSDGATTTLEVQEALATGEILDYWWTGLDDGQFVCTHRHTLHVRTLVNLPVQSDIKLTAWTSWLPGVQPTVTQRVSAGGHEVEFQMWLLMPESPGEYSINLSLKAEGQSGQLDTGGLSFTCINIETGVAIPQSIYWINPVTGQSSSILSLDTPVPGDVDIYMWVTYGITGTVPIAPVITATLDGSSLPLNRIIEATWEFGPFRVSEGSHNAVVRLVNNNTNNQLDERQFSLYGEEYENE